MLSLSTKRMDYLAAGDYTDCRCVRIVREDGVILGITTHHKDVGPLDGVLYQSGTGYSASALASNSQLSVDNMEVTGTYGALGITRSDLEGGLYQNSSLFMFDTDYLDPVADEQPKKSGHKGNVITRDNTFTIEFRSLTQMLQQPVGRLYSVTDDYDLAGGGIDFNPADWVALTGYAVRDQEDVRVGDMVKPTVWSGYFYICATAGTSGASEPTWTTTGLPDVNDGTVVWQSIVAPRQEGTVTGVTDRQTFDYSGSVTADGWLAPGEVTWKTGNNANLVMEAVSDVTDTLGLFLPMPSNIQIGDTFDVVIGYDRKWRTLRTRFKNVRNFGGFPFIPGPTVAGRVGGQG